MTTYFHQDGFPDLALGLGYLVLALTMSSHYGFIGILAPAMALLMLLKKKITAPRIGLVNLSEATRFSQFITAMVLMGLSLVIFLILVYKSPITLAKNEFVNYYLLYFAIVLSIAPAIAGIGGPKRFFIYQVLVLIGIGICLWNKYSLVLSFLIPGILFCLIGAGMLLNFLKKHPKQQEVMKDEKA
jgi:hypothetical protein